MPFTKLICIAFLCTACVLAGCLRNKEISEKAPADHCPNLANTFWSAPTISNTQPVYEVRFLYHIQPDYKGKSTIYTLVQNQRPEGGFRLQGDTLAGVFSWSQDCNTFYAVPEKNPGIMVTWIYRNDSLLAFTDNNPDSLNLFMLPATDSLPPPSLLVPETVNEAPNTKLREP